MFADHQAARNVFEMSNQAHTFITNNYETTLLGQSKLKYKRYIYIIVYKRGNNQRITLDWLNFSFFYNTVFNKE